MKLQAIHLTQEMRGRIVSATEEVAPRVLPADWGLVESYVNARIYQGKGMRVFVEVEYQTPREYPTRDKEMLSIAHRIQDGVLAPRLWLHVSFSRRDKIPTYDDIIEIKELFVGDSRSAFMVFPPRQEHYNHHQYCLHLFAPLDKNPLPDFRDPDGRL